MQIDYKVVLQLGLILCLAKSKRFQIMKRKNDLFFLSEIDFRNQLVEHLANWIMASTNQQVMADRTMLR